MNQAECLIAIINETLDYYRDEFPKEKFPGEWKSSISPYTTGVSPNDLEAIIDIIRKLPESPNHIPAMTHADEVLEAITKPEPEQVSEFSIADYQDFKAKFAAKYHVEPDGHQVSWGWNGYYFAVLQTTPKEQPEKVDEAYIKDILANNHDIIRQCQYFHYDIDKFSPTNLADTIFEAIRSYLQPANKADLEKVRGKLEYTAKYGAILHPPSITKLKEALAIINKMLGESK